MFPIFLDLTGRRVIVIGGGVVGQRKLAALQEARAAIRLIEPQAMSGLPPGVTHLAEPYQPRHLDGATLAFACATSEVNAQVVADARERGVWVNAASAPAAGDFVLPAVVRQGDLTLAVSTGGAAPALARRIREKLESEFDATFAEWVRVLAEVRREVLATVADEARRRELLDAFADWPWLARLRAEGAEAVLAAMQAQL